VLTPSQVQRVALNASQLHVSSSTALRVGYLSADFRHIHPVGRDLAAILPRHTHRFVLNRFCVSNRFTVIAVLVTLTSLLQHEHAEQYFNTGFVL
jgi:hypothetical protein